jgi:hypothetical protein
MPNEQPKSRARSGNGDDQNIDRVFDLAYRVLLWDALGITLEERADAKVRTVAILRWMHENLTTTQARCTELLEENRRLKRELDEARAFDPAQRVVVEREVDVHPIFAAVVERVYAERTRQNAKWGREHGTWNDPALFKLAVLSEEHGEVARIALDMAMGLPEHVEGLRAELVQVAAVAIQWLETFEPGAVGSED